MVMRNYRSEGEDLIGPLPSVEQIVDYCSGKIIVRGESRVYMEKWKALYELAGVQGLARNEVMGMRRLLRHAEKKKNYDAIDAGVNIRLTRMSKMDEKIWKKIEERAKENPELAALIEELHNISNRRLENFSEELRKGRFKSNGVKKLTDSFRFIG